MKSLRVCIVAGSYPPARCGIGDYSELLARHLASHGLQVSVITSSYLGTRPQEGNPTVLPVVRSWRTINLGVVTKAILGTSPDVVVFQFPNTEYFPRRILFNLLIPSIKLLRKSARVVVTFHEVLDRKAISWKKFFALVRLWLSLIGSDAIVVVWPSYRETLDRIWPRMKRTPCKVIPIASPVEASRLSPEELQHLRIQSGVCEKAFLLTYFGFVNRRKGFEQIIEVLETLRRQGLPAELVVAGDLSESNPYHRELLARIGEKGLTAYVKIMGHQDPVAVSNYLAMSDANIFAFTDGAHSKSTTFLAAVSQGVFTVTTSFEKHGFVDTENVYYTTPGDVPDMVNALLQYRGRQIPPDSVPWPTWNRVTEEYLELFSELVFPRDRAS